MLRIEVSRFHILGFEYVISCEIFHCFYYCMYLQRETPYQCGWDGYLMAHVGELL
jgi:hypothetical protein